MTELGSNEFSSYFKAVHCHEPFPWQVRLTEQVLKTGSWPEVIDLPTGTGKTATLDTAIFTLAADPSRFPRRVVFVIDRRIVVDQVYERADRIKEKLKGGGHPVLDLINQRLSALTDGPPLGAVALRGGIPIDSEWAHRPDQPWVMVSTVDQFGSRLLFRGYGVSKRMRPVHAGLAGNDCLVILDEVHLSRPFSETLEAITAFQTEGPMHRFQVVEMSATPSQPRTSVFRLTPSDLEGSAELRLRAEAPKQACLAAVGKAKEPAHLALPPAISKIIAGELPDEARSVGVIVNRVKTAREVHRALSNAGCDAHLVTGRMRPLDRQEVLGTIEKLVDPSRKLEPNAPRTIVVSTQAIEVGADFSFDALITECAPANSLRQRFGRLDRRGRFQQETGQPARAWILGVKADIESKVPDSIYGERAKATWTELSARFGDTQFDVGPMSESLTSLPYETTKPGESAGQDDQAPLMLRSHLDALVQTNPEPPAQPMIEPFLHGWGVDDNPDVSLVWRWDRSKDVLALVPPRPTEFLDVPIWAARAWLAGDDEMVVGDTRTAPEDLASDEGKVERWNGREDGVSLIEISQIRPGDILLVDPRMGGIGGGTWDPTSTEAVTDLGDQAQLEYRRTVTLRLDGRVLPSDVLPVPSPDSEAEDESAPTLRAWLDLVGKRGDWLGEAAKALTRKRKATTVSDYLILSAPRGGFTSHVDPATMDGSDATGSFTGSGVLLDDHLAGVGSRAGATARRLGLPEDLATDLELAGRLHDLGKVDQRFQLELVGGDLVAHAMLEKPLAKSLPGVRQVWIKPKGMRHELASLAMIESNPEVLASAHDPDLVLHLIGTHHGYGRPLPPVVDDPNPERLQHRVGDLELDANSQLINSPLALEMAERFWRLVDRYGHHGLAWLEAILRLADHRQSAEESTK